MAIIRDLDESGEVIDISIIRKWYEFICVARGMLNEQIVPLAICS